MHINEKRINYLIKEILDFRINKKRKYFIIKFKDYLMYKIKYINYDNNDNLLI